MDVFSRPLLKDYLYITEITKFFQCSYSDKKYSSVLFISFNTAANTLIFILIDFILQLGTPNSKGRVLRIDTSFNTSQEYSEYISSLKLHRPLAEQPSKKLVSVIKGSKSANKNRRKLKVSSKYRNRLLYL